MTTRDRIIHAVILLSLFGAFALSKAEAQTRSTPCNASTPNNAVCLTWGAVATRTDGLPTTFPVTYRAEQQAGTGTFTTLSTVSATQFYVQNLAPGAYTFRVFAIENSLVSAASNLASRTIVQAPPTAPVIVIAVVIGVDHSPVYTVLADGTRSNTVGGFAAVGTECTGPVLFRYRNRDYREPKKWKPWSTSVGRKVAVACA